MPLLQILPTDQSFLVAEIDASDADEVLQKVQQLSCKEADVLHDGDYCFSVRLDDNGVWCIFRSEAEADNAIPFS